nr:MAG TPA: hypothetical protein [Caudoviricetes sp.]
MSLLANMINYVADVNTSEPQDVTVHDFTQRYKNHDLLLVADNEDYDVYHAFVFSDAVFEVGQFLTVDFGEGTAVENIVTFIIEGFDCIDAEGTAFELVLRVVEELDI